MNQTKKILCFGEILLRFSPASELTSFEAQQMPFYVGGAELNVANALALWNVPVSYCTAMPKGFFFDNIKKHLALQNIDISPIIDFGNRMGVYYLEQGSDVKNANIIFDRENSSFSNLKVGMIDWRTILKDCQWFHFSAIAASLTLNAFEVCLEALKVAKEMNITISIDLNYRSKLWNYGKLPTEIIPELVSYCDVVMGNIWAAEKMLGINPNLPINIDDNHLLQAAELSIQTLMASYPKIKKVAYTFRFDEHYWAVFYQNNQLYKSKIHALSQLVDKVGSGDCFMAGLIYGSINAFKAQEIIDFAAQAAVGKLYEKGDATQQKLDQILNNLTH